LSTPFLSDGDARLNAAVAMLPPGTKGAANFTAPFATFPNFFRAFPKNEPTIDPAAVACAGP
jgi:hypothetical protein